jgi:hypothetical protein
VAAIFLKTRLPHSEITVCDTQTDVTAITHPPVTKMYLDRKVGLCPLLPECGQISAQQQSACHKRL